MYTSPTQSNQKKILIVTPLVPPESGGPSYYSVALQEAFQKKGIDTDIIAFKEVRKYPSGIRHILFLYKVLWASRKVDALIILDTVSVALPAVLAGWFLNKKIIVRVGGDFVWERYIERTGEKVLLSEFYKKQLELTKKEKVLIWLQRNIVCTLSTTIIFNTTWQRDLWEKPYNLLKEKTGVITNAFKKNAQEWQGGEAFLCVWRGTAFKNTDTLESAFKTVRETYPDATLEIYKDIPREELYGHMKHARALIIPSLTELSPNMAFEALGMGLPVLLTKDCGAYDLLDGAVTWIDPLNANDISEKMSALMNEEKYTEAKKKSVSFIQEHTYEEIAEEFLQILNYDTNFNKKEGQTL